MKIEAVHAFMALPPRTHCHWSRKEWDILRNPEAFVCVEYGQEPESTVENWNHVVEPAWAVTATSENASTPGGWATTLVCNGRSAQALYLGSRDDCLLDALALNSVAKPDMELRLCKDSVGNSDLWYLPLTPTQWEDLETHYGAEQVSQRFAPLPDTLDAFVKLLARESRTHS